MLMKHRGLPTPKMPIPEMKPYCDPRYQAEFINLTADNVLLRLLNPERMSHGLWIPDGAQREAYELWRGEVVKVGPGTRTKSGARIPVALNPGDVVGFYWLAGRANVTAWPDPAHRIIPESAIQVVYE